MARQTLVLDASVGVKWFSAKDEDGLSQALTMRDQHVAGDILIVVPDLFYYEVANALAHKKSIPTKEIQSALSDLFALGLKTVAVGAALLTASITLSRQFGITIYDSCYIALAQESASPLVTANPRHQGKSFGCKVISVEARR